MKKIDFLKNLRVFRDTRNPDLLQIQVTGIAKLTNLVAPVFTSNEKQKGQANDGIYEIDLCLGNSGKEPIDVDMEMDIVFQLKKIPEWVKGIRVNAEENSEIELI